MYGGCFANNTINLQGVFTFSSTVSTLTSTGGTDTSTLSGTMTITAVTTSVPATYKIEITETDAPVSSFVVGSAPDCRVFTGIGNNEYNGMFYFTILSTTAQCGLGSFQFKAYSQNGTGTRFSQGLAKRVVLSSLSDDV